MLAGMEASASRSALALTVAVIGAAAGCEDVANDPSWVSRDSAGIEIVENHAPSWRTGEAWTVSGEPAVEVGVTEGAEHFMFDRIAGVIAVNDALVVANGGTGEIRFFDAAGEVLRSVGSEGEGPGEYRAIDRIGHWENDSVFVYDRRLNRVSILGPGGDFAHSFSASSPEIRTLDLQPLTNGEWIGQDGFTLKPGAPGTVSRDTAYFYLLNPSEGALDTIAAVPAERTFTFSIQGQEGYRYAPLTPSPAWAVRGQDFYVTSGEDFQLQVVGRDGEVDRIIRRSAAPEEATEDDMAAWREAVLAGVPDPARPHSAPLPIIGVPHSHPPAGL